MTCYPKFLYHPEKAPRVVKSKEEHEALGPGWVESPAEFGVETCPGKTPDPVIALQKASMAPAAEGAAPAMPKKSRKH